MRRLYLRHWKIGGSEGGIGIGDREKNSDKMDDFG